MKIKKCLKSPKFIGTNCRRLYTSFSFIKKKDFSVKLPLFIDS